MTAPTDRPIPTLDDLRARRDEIIALAARYHASNVRVFGSVARGDATADSDYDLLVTMPKGTHLYDLAMFWQEMGDLLGRKVDLLTDGALDGEFEQLVNEEAVAL
jgi:hypothetical protein